MFNHKTNNADLKNCTADLKNNTSDSRNNNGDSKNNNADLKNNSADSKMNRLESRNYNADFKSNPDSKPNADAPAQGDSGDDNMPPSPVGQGSHNGNKVYKSGPLFLSSKGIGWTSWKKRWFILTETSLVFFRSDPNAVPQKGGEANLTLGGIDLNSSGSVVVKADKKLLTVLFPDGRDGRAFTLKAETSEDLFEWKNALEEALANAPSVATGPGQNGTLKNEKGDNAADGSQEQSTEQASPKSIVLGRPILLALEDIDGTPSFLEKALRYVEDHGVRVEGILRQAADVDDVEHRIREYEQGKTEFTANEDGHVMGDCIKYVLRELPSPPVPASCCAALLEAYRSDRATRVSAMRAAVLDTFPEPNRRLLQRILIMMEAVAEHKSVNRMSVSAVAACMSPLLLRPLLAGEVDLGKGPEMGGDGSAQLLQAAAAANHAQAIVIILLEEYDKIFGEEDMVSDLYSDSEEYGSESEDLSDEYYEEDEDYEDEEDEDGEYTSECSRSYEDSAHGSSVTCSEDEKGSGSVSPDSISHEVINDSHSKMQAKKASMDSLEYVTEQQGEILRLEALKAKLKEKIEAESRQNVILKDDLVNKKHALEVQRVALQQEVSRLQQELQMEKGSQGIAPSSVSTNEKTMTEPEGIAHAEANDPVLQPPSPNQGKVKDKEKDREYTKTTSRRSKDTHSSKEYSDKNQFPSFSNKIPPGRSERASSSRRSNARGEAANTTSALSKLTNRLNFLKERRNQIADELQHIDKDHKSHKHHRSSRKWSESPQMSDDSNTSETHHQGQKESSFQQTEATTDKGRSEDQSTSHSNIDDKTYTR